MLQNRWIRKGKREATRSDCQKSWISRIKKYSCKVHLEIMLISVICEMEVNPDAIFKLIMTGMLQLMSPVSSCASC